MRLVEGIDITKSVIDRLNESDSYDANAERMLGPNKKITGDGYTCYYSVIDNGEDSGLRLRNFNGNTQCYIIYKHNGKTKELFPRPFVGAVTEDQIRSFCEELVKNGWKDVKKSIKEAEETNTEFDTNSLESLKEVMNGMLENASDMEKEVIEDQLDEVDGYDSPKDFIEHLCDLGITGGGVSSMIYYDDTLDFLERHAEEINQLLSEGISEFGSLEDMFGDNYDSSDPMNLDTHNRNLFAWYAYEETARRIAEAINEAGNYGANI